MGIIRMSSPVRNIVKGLFFKDAGARPLGVEGRARQRERLGSSLYVVGALPLVS